MKKFIYLFIVLFAFASLTSCGSKKKGCGLTADATTIPTQEIILAEVTE